MRKTLQHRRRDDGSPLVEYGLIVALIVAALGTLTGNLAAVLSGVGAG